MDNTNVSRNNGFLMLLGIINSGKKKGPTEIGMRLGQALEFEVEDHVSEIWRAICEENDFLRNLVSSVRIRKGMELNALRAHVAYSAGQSKSASVLTGAGTVIEILKAANLISEKDGKYVATDLGSVTEKSEFRSPGLEPPSSTTSTGTQPAIGTSSNVASIQTGSGIAVSIQISCKPDDLDGLGAKIRQLIKDIQSREDPNKSPENEDT